MVVEIITPDEAIVGELIREEPPFLVCVLCAGTVRTVTDPEAVILRA
jgi:hypothetical protein